MKSLFLATAAVAAFAAAPALAQEPVGSIGVAYSNAEFDLGGLDADSEAASVDASFAVPVTADWTVSFDGALNIDLNEGPAEDDASFNGRVHVSRMFGSTRIAGFAGGMDAGEETLWGFGGQAQHYLNEQVTLTGSLAYETLEGVDADVWSLGADAAYFVSPKLRLNAGAGWTTVDAGGADLDGWSANLGGEYQIADTPFSVTAGYGHAEFEDIDLQADTFTIGFRYTYGGDLKARERAGGDLGRTTAGLGALAGAL